MTLRNPLIMTAMLTLTLGVLSLESWGAPRPPVRPSSPKAARRTPSAPASGNVGSIQPVRMRGGAGKEGGRTISAGTPGSIRGGGNTSLKDRFGDKERKIGGGGRKIDPPKKIMGGGKKNSSENTAPENK